MRIAYVLRTVMAGAAVVGLAAGCGTGKSVEGTAKPTTRNPDAIQVWDPCTQLGDEALRKTRVDPATKDVTTNPAHGPASWRVCSWNSTELPYFLMVLSTSHTQDESRANTKLTGFKDVTIGSRKGMTYQDKSDTRGDVCYVSLPAEQGMVEVAVSWRASKPITADRCERAIAHAQELEPYLPK
ncbi:DUF3558 domain-containing protein [Nocardia sp. XZ_19_385]|uniref:DUF3558 domain-containing protein n=1 Tax=Nocardia sp. XZ_19_385 TaxID=2769488 RepID=UPI00188EF9A8|nr:DUF3558 domain-containing protein [Nocardia sp. XZ_19_385]